MFDQLTALAALAREGTMAAAGTALRISQPAVSKRIAALEAQLGRKLVVRRGRRSVLTPAARALVDATTPLMAELRAAIKAPGLETAGPIRIGVSESVLASWGASLLARAREELGCELELHAHRSPVVLDRVRSGEYAAGVVAGMSESAPDLTAVKLLEEPMVVIPAGLRKRSLPRKRPLRVLTIEPRAATWESVSRPARRAGLEPGQTLESFFAVAQLARRGFGHGLVPIGVARALDIPSRAWLRLPGPRLVRPVSLAARPTTLGLPLLQALACCLVERSRKIEAGWRSRGGS